MGRALWLATSVLLLASAAYADDEDPRAAIAERGIVLKAGKRHHIIIVPEKTPDPSSKYPAGTVFTIGAKIYLTDGKTIYLQKRGAGETYNKDGESKSLADPREIGSAEIKRTGETYTLECSSRLEPNKPRRTIALTPSTTPAAKLSKGVLRDKPFGYATYLLARDTGGTTYYLVDRPRTENNDSKELRLFIGKRGALKKIPIKEIASDTKADVLVTAKGTLSIEKGKPTTAHFIVGKKSTEISVLPAYENRGLVYNELGVYAKDPSGFVCDEL